MYSPFEDKGKIFTDVIQKKPVEVIIHTRDQRITGTIHIRPQERLIDEMQKTELFIAVTNASIHDLNGELILETKFMVVHRDQISWIVPINELVSAE